VNDAIARRAFPGAVIEVGRTNGAIWRQSFGHLRYSPDAARTEDTTVFDLASLTKVVATTSLAMRLVARGTIGLDDLLRQHLTRWPATSTVRLRHLLDHSSGLPAHARLWESMAGRTAYEAAIAAIPVSGPPGQHSVYSDLGFMVLGFVLENAVNTPLDAAFDQFAAEWIGRAEMRFRPPDPWRDRIAPTEVDPWRGRELVGEVHDENAAALGGVAAHAGLFGTAEAVGAFARLVLGTREGTSALGTSNLLRVFTSRTGVPESSRALGWDTMLPTSSCGHLMSPDAIGHTGFTGTSLWIDPTKDVYVVILTNRVHPTRDNDQLRDLRPRLHDAIMERI
jgi:CubicO group peptidase (beta-lactamase class C family)